MFSLWIIQLEWVSNWFVDLHISSMFMVSSVLRTKTVCCVVSAPGGHQLASVGCCICGSKEPGDGADNTDVHHVLSDWFNQWCWWSGSSSYEWKVSDTCVQHLKHFQVLSVSPIWSYNVSDMLWQVGWNHMLQPSHWTPYSDQLTDKSQTPQGNMSARLAGPGFSSTHHQYPCVHVMIHREVGNGTPAFAIINNVGVSGWRVVQPHNNGMYRVCDLGSQSQPHDMRIRVRILVKDKKRNDII